MVSLAYPIQKDYILADVVEQWPVTAMVMLRYGLHCVGCQVSAVDSVEEGAASHGMDEQTIDKMMSEMNKAVKLVEARKALEDKRGAAQTSGTTAAVEGESCACGKHGSGGCGCGGHGASGHSHGKEEGHGHAEGDACACGGSCGC